MVDNSADAPTHTVLSREQLRALADIAEKHKAAQRQLTKAMGALWSAQIDMAVATQSVTLLREVSARPLGLFDDCNCCSEIIIIARRNS